METVSSYTNPNGDLIRIDGKIRAVPALAALYTYIESSAGIINIHTSDALAQADQTTLDGIVNGDAPPPVDQVAYVKAKILAAMDFGKNLMAEYGASNVIARLTVDQVKQIMVQTTKLQSSLLSGSLYVALDDLAAIPSPIYDSAAPTVVIISTDAITTFRHKIQTYLNIPLT